MEYLRPGPVGVAICLFVCCSNVYYFWFPLFSDKVWVALGHRGSWIYNDPSCNKFPVKARTWNVLVTLHPQEGTLWGTQWISIELINGILLSRQVQIIKHLWVRRLPTIVLLLESWQSFSNDHKSYSLPVSLPPIKIYLDLLSTLLSWNRD